MNKEQQWVTLEGTEGPGRGKHILFISGDEEYRSEESLPMLALRTATHAFEYKKDPENQFAKYTWNHKVYDGGYGRQVLGETWVSHHGHHAFESTRAVPSRTMQNHPILKGVNTMWGPADVYEAHPPEDAEVLVDGHVLTGMDPNDPLKPDTPTMPVAWIRLPGKPEGTGRVFCTTMGAAVDLKDQSLRRLVINGIYWCMGMEKEISKELSVNPVGDYNPTYFGYGDFLRDKKPQEFFNLRSKKQ